MPAKSKQASRHHRYMDYQEVPSSEVVNDKEAKITLLTPPAGRSEEVEEEEGGEESDMLLCSHPPHHRRNAAWARAFCLGENAAPAVDEKEKEVLKGLAEGMGVLGLAGEVGKKREEEEEEGKK